jgi:hypothetical protein
MKGLICIFISSIIFALCSCSGQVVDKAPMGENTISCGNDLQIKTDTLPSDIDKIKLVITYSPLQKSDYIAEHESGVSDTSKYAKDREVNKGQIYFPCINKQMHDYRISKNTIVSIVSIKYNMAVYDKTDYIFTQDTIFEVHTSTANAGIFTNSDIKYKPNVINIANSGEYHPASNGASCNFNEYLFGATLNFCKKNSIVLK